MKHVRITILLSLAIMFMLAGCASLNAAVQVAEAIPPEAMFTATPAPSATPGTLDETIRNIAISTGIDQVTFLGLTGEDWTNLVISILFVILSYVLSRLLVRYGLRLVTHRRDMPFWDEFIAAVAPSLSWLLVIFVIQFATGRLTFMNARTKTLLSNLYFTATVLIVAYIFWMLVNFSEHWYREKTGKSGVHIQVDPVIVMLKRVALFFITVIAFSILLSRFGLNTNALTITLGIVGVALIFAAQDTISDTISGFTILADRPFRVDDTIEVEAISDWGTVKQIGLRTTRILTYDNRMVIIPNSIIGKNLVINYTYPDPRYRMETQVDIPYGVDIETVRQILVKTIYQIDGVLPDKSVEVLCQEMGASAMILRVWWWIGDYDDAPFVRGKVIESMQTALLEKGITLAYPVRDVNLRVLPETVDQVSQAFGESD